MPTDVLDAPKLELPEGWDCAPLGSLVEEERGISYGIVQPGQFDDNGVPIIRVNNLRGGRILTDDVLRVGAGVEANYSRTRLRGGEVLLSLVGTLGECAVVPNELAGWNVARAVAVIPPKAHIDPHWVAMCLRSADVQALVRAWATTTVQATLNLRDVRRLPVLLPPEPDRSSITQAIKQLEGKIEQNRRTSCALEGLARAVFKAWFVDFEPVKARAAGKTSFPGLPPAAFAALPDRLTDSPLGPIPQGWSVSTIGAVSKRIAMGPFGSDIKTDNFVSDGVPVIRGGNLTDGFIDRDFVFLKEAKADQLANANAFPGDIVITHRGTLGQIGLIPGKSRYRRYVVSQSQLLIRPNAAMLPSHFLYLFLTSSAGQHELLANRSQTGVPAISRPTTSVKAISLILPQRSVVDAFEGFASILFNARVAVEAESTKLAALRDYLLPRLLSGRVRVQDRRSQAEVTT